MFKESSVCRGKSFVMGKMLPFLWVMAEEIHSALCAPQIPIKGSVMFRSADRGGHPGVHETTLEFVYRRIWMHHWNEHGGIMEESIGSIAPEYSHFSAAQQSSRYCRLKSCSRLLPSWDCESNQMYCLEIRLNYDSLLMTQCFSSFWRRAAAYTRLCVFVSWPWIHVVSWSLLSFNFPTFSSCENLLRFVLRGADVKI